MKELEKRILCPAAIILRIELEIGGTSSLE
jgi:hypothetical protein